MSRVLDHRLHLLHRSAATRSAVQTQPHTARKEVGSPEEIAGIGPDGMNEQRLIDNAKILWGYVNARDAAAACRLAIEADFCGFEPFNIVAPDTQSLTSTEDLLRKYTPNTEIRGNIPGTSSGFSTEKARRMLGWECHYGWRG